MNYDIFLRVGGKGVTPISKSKIHSITLLINRGKKLAHSTTHDPKININSST